MGSNDDTFGKAPYKEKQASDERRSTLSRNEALENVLDYIWEKELDDFIDFVKDGGEPQDHIFWDCLVANDRDPDNWLRTHGASLME